MDVTSKRRWSEADVLALVDDEQARAELAEMQLLWISDVCEFGLDDPRGSDACRLMLASVERLVRREVGRAVAGSSGAEFDDAYGCVVERLVKAIPKWDPSLPASPFTYMSNMVMYGLRDYRRTLRRYESENLTDMQTVDDTSRVFESKDASPDDLMRSGSAMRGAQYVTALGAAVGESARATFSSPVAFWLAASQPPLVRVG